MLQRAGRFLFGYDAAADRGRRATPAGALRSEDAVLKAGDRRKVQSVSREVQRNFTIASWAVRRHLDYVSTFSFQPRTGNDAVDARLAELVDWWGRPDNFEVGGRHGLQRWTRLLEARRTVDGDVFAMQLSDGRLQAIEGDRVRDPGDKHKRNGSSVVQGVEVDKAGRSRAFYVHSRGQGGNGFEFDRRVLASRMVQHGFFDRFDQVRGISPVTASLNTYRDVYEGFDYALAKAKIAQMFGLVLYRDALDSPAPVTSTAETDADGDGEAETSSGYEIDFGRGPVMLDLDPGDKAEFLENKTPAPEFVAFTQVMIAVAIKSLDLPYSFFDESHSNYSGSRQALLQYEMSAAIKRGDLQMILDRLLAWRVRLWIADGVLELPAGWLASDLRWEWMAAGLPWVDPLKEANADIAAVNAGLKTRTEVLRRRGRDFRATVDELAAENKYLKTAGVGLAPVSVAVDLGSKDDDEE
ncbi:phage portal protein [Symmachiella macrocystis]|nr:phage portal protein [Symmachiella macrocystis]